MNSVLKFTGLIVFMLLMSCGSRIKHTDKNVNSRVDAKRANNIIGNYVSDFYMQRN